MRRRRASQHPQQCVVGHEFAHQLPPLGLHVLVGVSLVDHDQVKQLVLDRVLSDGGEAIVVDDDELGATVGDLVALLCVSIRYIHAAMHSELKQVLLPCALHDGQRAHNKNALSQARLHQVVSRPDN